MEKQEFKMSRQEAIEAICVYGSLLSRNLYTIMDMVLRSPEGSIALMREEKFLEKSFRREEGEITERLSRSQRKYLYRELTEEQKKMLTKEQVDIIEGRREDKEPMSQAERVFYSY